jgi:hypothetical protein
MMVSAFTPRGTADRANADFRPADSASRMKLQIKPRCQLRD